MAVGLLTRAIFGDLGGFFFGNVRDSLRPVIDCKMNDLE